MKYFNPSYWFKLWVLSAPFFNYDKNSVYANSVNNKNIKDLDNNSYENLSSTNYQQYLESTKLPIELKKIFYQPNSIKKLNRFWRQTLTYSSGWTNCLEISDIIFIFLKTTLRLEFLIQPILNYKNTLQPEEIKNKEFLHFIDKLDFSRETISNTIDSLYLEHCNYHNLVQLKDMRLEHNQLLYSVDEIRNSSNSGLYKEQQCDINSDFEHWQDLKENLVYKNKKCLDINSRNYQKKKSYKNKNCWEINEINNPKKWEEDLVYKDKKCLDIGLRNLENNPLYKNKNCWEIDEINNPNLENYPFYQPFSRPLT